MNYLSSAAQISENRQMLGNQQVYRRKYTVIVITFVREVQKKLLLAQYLNLWVFIIRGMKVDTY